MAAVAAVGEAGAVREVHVLRAGPLEAALAVVLHGRVQPAAAADHAQHSVHYNATKAFVTFQRKKSNKPKKSTTTEKDKGMFTL